MYKKCLWIISILLIIACSSVETPIDVITTQEVQTAIANAPTEIAAPTATLDVCADISVLQNAKIIYKDDIGTPLLVSSEPFGKNSTSFVYPKEVLAHWVSPNAEYIVYPSSVNGIEVLMQEVDLYWSYFNGDGFSLLAENVALSPYHLTGLPPSPFSADGKYLILATKEDKVIKVNLINLENKQPLQTETSIPLLSSEENYLTEDSVNTISHFTYRWSPNGEYVAIVVAVGDNLVVYLYKPTQPIIRLGEFPISVQNVNNNLKYNRIDLLWTNDSEILRFRYLTQYETRWDTLSFNVVQENYYDVKTQELTTDENNPLASQFNENIKEYPPVVTPYGILNVFASVERDSANQFVKEYNAVSLTASTGEEKIVYENTFGLEGNGIRKFEYSPDKRFLILTVANSSLSTKFIDLKTNTNLSPYQTWQMVNMSWSPDERFALFYDAKKNIFYFDQCTLKIEFAFSLEGKIAQNTLPTFIWK